MAKRTILHHERGATAIEYAVIAGLIGLGLVGSLLTTKTSLNATYSGLARHIGGDASAGPSQTVAPNGQLAVFANKTVATQKYYNSSAGRPQGSYRWTYTDGSYVTMTVDNGAGYYYSLVYQDVDSPYRVAFVGDRYGNTQGFYQSTYDANGKKYQDIFTQLGEFTNGIPDSQGLRTFYPSGYEKTTVRQAPTADYLSLFNDNLSNFNYYKSQMPILAN